MPEHILGDFEMSNTTSPLALPKAFQELAELPAVIHANPDTMDAATYMVAIIQKGSEGFGQLWQVVAGASGPDAGKTCAAAGVMALDMLAEYRPSLFHQICRDIFDRQDGIKSGQILTGERNIRHEDLSPAAAFQSAVQMMVGAHSWLERSPIDGRDGIKRASGLSTLSKDPSDLPKFAHDYLRGQSLKSTPSAIREAVTPAVTERWLNLFSKYDIRSRKRDLPDFKPLPAALS